MAQWIENRINGFFGFVYGVEKLIAKTKACLKRNKWGKPLIYAVVVVACVLIGSGVFNESRLSKIITATICLILIISFYFSSILGWVESAVKLLGILICVNFIVTCMVVVCLISLDNRVNQILLFLAIYILLWITISLLANSRVSSIANSFIGAMSTVLFTVLSYIISLYPTDCTFNLPELWVEGLAKYDLTVIKISQEIIGLFLPFIGATALSLALIEAKKYWMQKNNLEEPY